jgi:ubiquinone/menaquinone biosynthesis C-methylase UbiE
MSLYQKSKPYKKLVLIYDHVMSHVKYDLWVSYLEKIAKKYLDKNSRVLELAAGNCRFAKAFSKYYPDLISTDFSHDMLKSSGETCFPKVCCEMTKLPFNSEFDFIYSTFDSVNYLTSKKKLLSLFCEVKRILSSKGIFTFDVSLERNSLVHSRESRELRNYQGIKYLQLSEYSSKSRIHKNIFQIQFDDDNKYIEVHKEKIYKYKTYFELLKKTGLQVEKCLETFTSKQGKANSKRIQFIVRHSNN